eukprot:6475263-Amphidinium_carterae.1
MDKSALLCGALMLDLDSACTTSMADSGAFRFAGVKVEELAFDTPFFGPMALTRHEETTCCLKPLVATSESNSGTARQIAKQTHHKDIATNLIQCYESSQASR